MGKYATFKVLVQVIVKLSLYKLFLIREFKMDIFAY